MTSETLLRELWLLETGVWSSFCEQIIAPRPLFVVGHLCSDEGCDNVAEYMCFWPGNTAPKCSGHRAGWIRVAEVLGFELTSKPLEVRDPDPSAARFAAMELY